MSFQVFGLPVSRGVAIGRAVLVASSRIDVAHYFVDETRVDAEVARLRVARDAVAGELSLLKRDLPAEAPGELAALLDVHLMLLHDDSLTGATKQWIHERHYNAEWALSAQLEVLARQFDEMEDDYLRERKADLEQVVERLLRALARGPEASFAAAPAVGARDFGGEEPLVLVANDIAPADMLQFKGSVFTGFVTDVGGKTSHTAIVARSMDIPAVVGARSLAAHVGDEASKDAAFELQHVGWGNVVGDQHQRLLAAEVSRPYRRSRRERRLRSPRESSQQALDDLFEVCLALAQVVVLHLVELPSQNFQLRRQGPLCVVVPFVDPLLRGAGQRIVVQQHEVHVQQCREFARRFGRQVALEQAEFASHGVACDAQPRYFEIGRAHV